MFYKTAFFKSYCILRGNDLASNFATIDCMVSLAFLRNVTDNEVDDDLLAEFAMDRRTPNPISTSLIGRQSFSFFRSNQTSSIPFLADQ